MFSKINKGQSCVFRILPFIDSGIWNIQLYKSDFIFNWLYGVISLSHIFWCRGLKQRKVLDFLNTLSLEKYLFGYNHLPWKQFSLLWTPQQLPVGSQERLIEASSWVSKKFCQIRLEKESCWAGGDYSVCLFKGSAKSKRTSPYSSVWFCAPLPPASDFLVYAF